jgi:hypothetical protein
MEKWKDGKGRKRGGNNRFMNQRAVPKSHCWPWAYLRGRVVGEEEPRRATTFELKKIDTIRSVYKPLAGNKQKISY